MNHFKQMLLVAVFSVLLTIFFINGFSKKTFAESPPPSSLIKHEDSYQQNNEGPATHLKRSSAQSSTTTSIIFTETSAENVILPTPEDAVSGGVALLAPAEISDTLTVSFQGTGSGMEQCSGEWGYQLINYNIEADIEVTAVNPIETDGIVTYELSSETGTIRFHGTAEDLFYGEKTILHFDRTQDLDLHNIEGTLKYSTGQCSNLYIGFTVHEGPCTNPDHPCSVYLQYDGGVGIVRNTVNMPYPWNAGQGCLGNNYDVPGKNDFDYCNMDLTIDKAPLPPGQTTKIHASSCLPIDPAQPLIWKIEPSEGYDAKVNANITPDGDLGEIATISDVEGEGWMLITVTNPSFPDCSKQATLLIGCGCGVTPNMCILPGNAFWELSSISARFNLGRTEHGESAGDIFLTAGTPDPENATPKILEVYELGNNLEVLKDINGLRQIAAPDAFIDINVIDAFSYTMSFYDRADVGSKAGGYYQISPGADPNVVWTIENPDAPSTVYERLRLTEDKDGLIKVTEYQWDDQENTWSLSRGNGMQVTTRMEENSGGTRMVTETIKDESGNIASEVQTTFRDITHNGQTSEEIIEIVEDPDGDALTMTRNWYEDPCSPGSCGKLAFQINPDGSWIRYEYDALERKIVEIRSWLDAPSDSQAESARAVYYDYTAQDASDSQAAEDARLPRKVTETILGIEVSTTFYVYINHSDGSRTIVTERAGTQGAVFGAVGNLCTTTEYYPYNDASADSWRIKSVTYPDGTKDSYSYMYGTYIPNGDSTQPGTFALDDGTDILERIKHGTQASSWGVAYKSTGDQNIYNALGDLLNQSTYVSIGDGYYSRIDCVVHTYDQFGHVLMTSRSNGTQIENTWDCCGKSSETDAQGIVRHFTYDDLGRTESHTKRAVDDVTTTYTYDAASRRLTQTVSAGGLSQSSSSVYDTAGRLIQRTDVSGLATGYSHTSDGRITTVVRPGGATEITERYLDSRVKSITGTAVIPRFYTYGINPTGTRWTRIDTGSPSSPMWETTTTDLLGHTVKVKKPGYTGTETSNHIYNDLGQLVQTSTTGLADTLYTYDEIGNQIQSGLDVDDNGSLDLASMDRITETEAVYTQYESDWWQERTQEVYPEDNVDTATVVSTSRSRLTGLGSDGLAAETISIDIHGNQTVSTETIDRTAKTVTRTIDNPDSTTDAVSISTNGLLTSSTSKSGVTTTYGYDSLERQTGVTDPRTGTTINHYNALGRVDYIQDPAGHQTLYTYDPASGRKTLEINALGKAVRFDYNDRGQLTRTWGDAVYPVEYRYDAYGRMNKMHTYRQELGWSGETWPGEGGNEDITTWHYQQSTGLLVGKEDDIGLMVTYTYGPGGQLTTRTWARTDDGSPLMTTYTYDPDTGELIGMDYSDTTPDISFTYNRLGRQETVTDAVGTRTFGYNAALQLETETITGLYNKTITWTYDESGMIGRPTGFNTGEDYAVTYDYDTFGRLNTVSWNVEGAAQTTTYTHVPDSDLIQQMTTDDGLQVANNYEPQRDLCARLENRFNSTLISQYDYAYDELGRRESVIKSGQAFEATGPGFNIYDYNDRSEAIESARYRGTNPTDTSDPVTSEYRFYTYDSIGNRIDHTEGVDTGTYTANSLNQYSDQITPQGGTRSFSYDDDGNLIETADEANTIQYQFNGENRLVVVQTDYPVDGDKKLEFSYDYMGRRVRKQVSTWQTDHWEPLRDILFHYDGWNMVGEWSSAGGPSDAKYYVWGLDLSQTLQGTGGVGGLIASFSTLPGDIDTDGDMDGSDLAQLISSPDQMDTATFSTQFGKAMPSSETGLYGNYFFYYGNGNVGQLVNAVEGGIVAHYEYDPFGDVIVAVGSMADDNPYRFSSKYYDVEGDFYYYGYRYYWSELGRWLNRDPIGESGGKNLLSFVFNGPLIATDYLGMVVNIKFIWGMEDWDLYRPPSGYAYFYSCKCGWLDYKHIKEYDARYEKVLDQIRNGSQTIKTIVRIPFLGTEPYEYEIPEVPGSLNEQKELAVEILKKNAFSEEQTSWDNIFLRNITGFSIEDLPSDYFGILVGKHRKLSGKTFEEIFEKLLIECETVSKKDAKEVFINNKETIKKPGHKKFSPSEDINDCGICDERI